MTMKAIRPRISSCAGRISDIDAYRVDSLFVCPWYTSRKVFDQHLADSDMTRTRGQHKRRLPLRILRYLIAVMTSIQKILL